MWVIAWMAACYVSDAELFDVMDRDRDGELPLEVGGKDCDNDDPDVRPGATELCNGIDDDCNGLIDDDGIGGPTFYRDDDGDGYGVDNDTIAACARPEGYAADPGDCDDGDPSRNPAATDLCDGVDQDCDGAVDDDATFADWYPDADGDGLGAEGQAVSACQRPEGYLPSGGDCDDADPAVGMRTFYDDADQDGFGSPDAPTEACTLPSGHVATADDCDDFNDTVHPGATEICENGIDEDCDGGPNLCGLGGYPTVQDGLLINGLAGFVGDVDGLPGDDFIVVDVAGHPLIYSGGPTVPSGLGAPILTVAWEGSETFADMDGDGWLDIVASDSNGTDPASGLVTGSAHVVLGGPALAGTVDPASQAAADIYGATLGALGYVSTGDVDCDGDVELIASDRTYDLGQGTIGRLQYLEYAPGRSTTDDAWGELLGAVVGAIPSFAGAADLTGDGCADVLVEVGSSTATTTSYFFQGPMPAHADLDDRHNEVALGSILPVGDLDDDGSADMAFAYHAGPSGTNQAGEVHLFFGPATGFEDPTSSDVQLEGTGNQNAAYLAPSSPGVDVDGNGSMDLIVGAPALGSFLDPGGIYLLYGPLQPGYYALSTDADRFIPGGASQALIGALTTVGDLDADGDSDLLVIESATFQTYALFGAGF